MVAPEKYQLHDLLKVRQLRENAAAKQWLKQKEVVAQVESEIDRRRNELADFRNWRIARENELFEEIMNCTVRPKELENLRFRIQKLRDDESNFQSRVIETQERLQKERRQLEIDHQSYQQAFRQRCKLDEHKAVWVQQAEREYEAAEEREVDDFKSRIVGLAGEGV